MLTDGAEQNHVEAMFWLGLLYYNNEHSEEASSTADYTQAYKWWTAAAELGCLLPHMLSSKYSGQSSRSADQASFKALLRLH